MTAEWPALGLSARYSPYPEWDYWEQDLETAKAMCLDLWGVPTLSWGEVPT